MNPRTIFGPLLILLGAYLLFSNGPESYGPGTIFGYFWPTLFVIPLGLFFHWLYFFMTNRRGVGLLVPGGVLLTAGLVCQVSMLFDSWGYTWPGFILAAAVGLFELYWFGGRNRWLLIPINILTVLSLLFFAVFSVGSLLNHLTLGRPFLAGAVILIGALMIIMRKKEV
ncbi:hypothetical protein [Paenibacillus mendelii]|uniref:DUF5668 domain-containing protein n=1 Tax=Paenibacillus mendelii TaxID=206163 RepID=A0ABV6J8N4_9BACL|nr:hypothetical protein [Paenibacillus mendelii]MCQ6561451.1 hypothetical protein [Paenibacillus mendelii]